MNRNGRVFGQAPVGTTCQHRAAAYAVISRSDGRVATVGHHDRYFLPGGGSEGSETPEATVAREVAEEVGVDVRIIGCLGEAVQYFYAADDDRWYEMAAVFFRVAEIGEPRDEREHDIVWLDPRSDRALFFHECHAWAACLRGGGCRSDP